MTDDTRNVGMPEVTSPLRPTLPTDPSDTASLTREALQYATAQEIFDRVVGHLRKQGRKATVRPTATACVYRAEDGAKCAMGCMIPDADYNPKMEGRGSDAVCLSSGYDFAPLLELEGHVSMLAQLQQVHDTVEPVGWEWAWARVAARFNLHYTAPGAAVPQ